MRDHFVDMQIRHSRASLGRFEARNDCLEQLQEVFKEPSEIGLSAMMDRFWIAWQELSGGATDPGRRTAVVQEATTLASAFGLISRQLKEASDDIQVNIDSLVHSVNATAEGIARLNHEIVRGGVVGENVSDLMDQRDLLLDQLARDVNVTVVETPEGQINVSVGSRLLVSGVTAFKMDANGSFSGGRIQGLLEAKNEIIPAYQEKLNQLAQGLKDRVNAQHKAGVDMNGGAGLDFFTGTGAADLAVNDALKGDPNKIAASQSATGPGDGSNALAIAQLKDALAIGTPPTASFRDFYGSIITELGLATQESSRAADVYDGVLEQQQMRRDAVSGVSLDEELMQLVRYQAAYDAASRLVSVMDEMLDTLINRTGIVGR
jgi:flagellar hook-associated protein 1 FlgK